MSLCILSCVWCFMIPWTVARWAPLSIGLSRQEYWSGLPFLPPGKSSQLRGQSHVFCGSYTSSQILYHWNTWEPIIWLSNPNTGYITFKKYNSKRHTYPIFTEALFTTAMTWKQLRCPPTDEWIKLWYKYTIECYSAIKRNKCESAELRRMNREPLIHSEANQKWKKQYCILMICMESRKMVQMSLFVGQK